MLRLAFFYPSKGKVSFTCTVPCSTDIQHQNVATTVQYRHYSACSKVVLSPLLEGTGLIQGDSIERHRLNLRKQI